MLIYVDIDMTICKTPCVDGINMYEDATPIISNIEKINKLYNDRNIIVYWTARGAATKKDYRELTKEQLKRWGAKYHKLRMGDKPRFDLLIDDKAINIDAI